MADLLRILFNSMQTGSTYALAALGIVLIWRTSRTTNFAQGSIGTINAYVAGYPVSALGLEHLGRSCRIDDNRLFYRNSDRYLYNKAGF